MTTRYVQHISGQGEKWQLDEYQPQAHAGLWKILVTDAPVPWLPKSEYRLVEPPERWVDVTKDCEAGVVYTNISMGSLAISGAMRDGYRLRKVQVNLKAELNTPAHWAFLVERKESA